MGRHRIFRAALPVTAVVAVLVTVCVAWAGRRPLAVASHFAHDPGVIRYVAIGDSYTCGTGTDARHAWPTVLTQHLRAEGVPIELIANPAHDGWTTQNALDEELSIYRDSAPTFATLMIGVNDTYRMTSIDTFRTQLETLIGAMRDRLPDKRRLILVTIPDYSVTRSGASFAHMNNAVARIGIFNGIIKDEAKKFDLPLVDLNPLSRQMGMDGTLVADDQLHPSAKEYALWEKAIYPIAHRLLAPPQGVRPTKRVPA